MLKASERFAVGGEGGYVAQSSLLRRECNLFMEMEMVMYLAFEAKT